MSAKESWLVFWSTCNVFALVWNGVQTLSFVLELALKMAGICRAFHVVVFGVFVSRSACWFKLLANSSRQHDLDISLESRVCLGFHHPWRHFTEVQRLRSSFRCMFKGWEPGWQPWQNHLFGRRKYRIHRQFNQLFVLESRPADWLENIVSVLSCKENRV